MLFIILILVAVLLFIVCGLINKKETNVTKYILSIAFALGMFGNIMGTFVFYANFFL